MADNSYSAQWETGDRSFLPLPTAPRLTLTARGLAAQGRDGRLGHPRAARPCLISGSLSSLYLCLSLRHPPPEAATRHPIMVP